MMERAVRGELNIENTASACNLHAMYDTPLWSCLITVKLLVKEYVQEGTATLSISAAM